MKNRIRNTLLMMSAGIMLFTLCSQEPKNPFNQEEKTNFSFINDKKPGDSVWTINIADTFTLRVIEEQLKYIDSLTIRCGTDTTITIRKNPANYAWEDTVEVKCLFSSAGPKVIIGELYYNGKITVQDSIKIFVRGSGVDITEQPDTVITVNERQPLEMCVTATGTDPLTYDWYYNDTMIMSSEKNCVRRSEVNMIDSGVYYCVVKNQWGPPDTSKKITVRVIFVNRSPRIDVIADTIRVSEGDTVKIKVFSVDYDEDSIRLAVIGLPLNSRFTDSINGRGLLTWITGYDDSGSYPIQIIASDGQLTDTQKTTIRVDEKYKEYKITSTAGTGGKITPSDSVFIPSGKSQTMVIAADTGYHVKDVVVNGVRVGPVQSYVFSNVKNAGTISATFEINTYVLKILNDGNGSTSPADSIVAAHNAQKTIFATPSPGYHFAKWARSNSEVHLGDTTMDSTSVSLTGNGTITALFSINDYILSVGVTGNGTTSPAGQRAASSQEIVNLTATPGTGNHFVKWTRSGPEVTIADSTKASTTVVLKATGSVTAVFAINTYLLTAASGGNGIVTPATPATVNYGVSTAITATPGAGYHFVRWIRSRSGVTITDSTLASTTVVLSDSGTVTAMFAINTYTLTARSGGHGSVTPVAPVTVNHGVSTAITATPATGYHFLKWTRSRSAVTIADSTLASTTANLTDTGIVTAVFAINTYSLTAVSAGSGSVIPASPITVNYGDSTAITATPIAGYHFVRWTRSRSAATIIDSTRASTKVVLTDSATVTAFFAVNTYSLTTAVTGGTGTVTPAVPATVNYGVSTAITATPGTGYHFVKWTRSGPEVTIGDSTLPSTTASLTASGTVVGVFAINTYTLDALSAGHGSVVPPTSQTVNYGVKTTITATPEVGYHFVRWTRSGLEATVEDSTLSSTTVTLTNTGSVTAYFAINTYSLTVASDAHGTVNPSGSSTVNYGIGTPIKATPLANYHFLKWVRSGPEATIADSSRDSTGVMLTGNGTVTAIFELNKFNLNTTSGGYGTVTPSGLSSVSYGVPTVISAIPQATYHFVKWTRSGSAATITDSSLASTTVVLTGDAIVTAYFDNFYYITVASGGNGTTSPAGTGQMGEGGRLTATATPNSGYHFVYWGITSGAATITSQFSVTTDIVVTSNNATVTAYFQAN